MKKTITHQFAFPHPPEVVWEYLTDSELLAQWLMPNDFKPVLGHQFQFGTKPRLKLGFDGRVFCTVLEIVTHKKLVYSWKGGMGKEKTLLDSVVTWTLTPTDNGTILHLEHTGFKGLKNFIPYIAMNAGWVKIGKRFIAKVNHEYTKV
jgi:uncharacterized protein YndB with AHSA1/START domain